MQYYYLCCKCEALQEVPAEVDLSSVRFHLHRNAWWPLLVVTAERARQLAVSGQAIYKNEEPVYTVDEMHERKTQGSPVQEIDKAQPVEEKVEVVLPVTPAEVYSCDWDEALRTLLKEGK